MKHREFDLWNHNAQRGLVSLLSGLSSWLKLHYFYYSLLPCEYYHILRSYGLSSDDVLNKKGLKTKREFSKPFSSRLWDEKTTALVMQCIKSKTLLKRKTSKNLMLSTSEIITNLIGCMFPGVQFSMVQGLMTFLFKLKRSRKIWNINLRCYRKLDECSF